MSSTERFLCEAIALARDNIRKGGRPFGAVVVRDGEVIDQGGAIRGCRPREHGLSATVMGPMLPALAAALIALPVAAQSLCGRMAFPAAAIKEFSSDFGRRGGRLHPGLDFTGTRGTAIRAAADGVVAYAGRYYGYGNMVDIAHRDGTITRRRTHVRTVRRLAPVIRLNSDVVTHEESPIEVANDNA